MQTELILSVTSEDRPGVVERLAKAVAGHSGNWIDSAMARLGGEFAGIVRVSIAEEDAQALREALLKLGQDGIMVNIRAGAPAEPDDGRHAILELTAQDHPGIVRDVSHVLAGHAVNVLSLHTNVFTGSMSGQAMFFARADIVLPSGLSLDDLKTTLEDLGGDIVVDLEPAEPA